MHFLTMYQVGAVLTTMMLDISHSFGTNFFPSLVGKWIYVVNPWDSFYFSKSTSKIQDRTDLGQGKHEISSDDRGLDKNFETSHTKRQPSDSQNTGGATQISTTPNIDFRSQKQAIEKTLNNAIDRHRKVMSDSESYDNKRPRHFEKPEQSEKLQAETSKPMTLSSPSLASQSSHLNTSSVSGDIRNQKTVISSDIGSFYDREVDNKSANDGDFDNNGENEKSKAREKVTLASERARNRTNIQDINKLNQNRCRTLSSDPACEEKIGVSNRDQQSSDSEDKRGTSYISTPLNTEDQPDTLRIQNSSHKAINRPYKILFDPESRDSMKPEHSEKSEENAKSKTDQSATSSFLTSSSPTSIKGPRESLISASHPNKLHLNENKRNEKTYLSSESGSFYNQKLNSKSDFDDKKGNKNGEKRKLVPEAEKNRTEIQDPDKLDQVTHRTLSSDPHRDDKFGTLDTAQQFSEATYASTTPNTQDRSDTDKMQSRLHIAINRPYKVLFDPERNGTKSPGHLKKSGQSDKLQPKSKTSQPDTSSSASAVTLSFLKDPRHQLNSASVPKKSRWSEDKRNKKLNTLPDGGSFYDQGIDYKRDSDIDLNGDGGNESVGKKTNKPRSGTTMIDGENCPTCSKTSLGLEEAKKKRILFVEDQLIKQLNRASDVPGTNRIDAAIEKRSFETNVKLPDSLIQSLLRSYTTEQENSDFYKKKEVAIFISGQELSSRSCIDKRTTGCYTFDLRGKLKPELNVSEAQLWLYKMRDKRGPRGQIYIIHQLEKFRGRVKPRKRLARKRAYVKRGWVTLNLTSAVKQWIVNKHYRQLLSLRCKNCVPKSFRRLFGAKQDFKPLLVIKYAESQHVRKRRTTESCESRLSCCKKDLNFDFTRLDFNIIAPQSLNIGYCHGPCDAVHQDGHNNNARLRKKQLERNASLQELTPCCAPTSLLNTRVARSDKGNIVVSDLHNVKVGTCGCM